MILSSFDVPTSNLLVGRLSRECFSSSDRRIIFATFSCNEMALEILFESCLGKHVFEHSLYNIIIFASSYILCLNSVYIISKTQETF